ncbi:MAG: hypothetical protein WAU07_04565 [Microgenomates group bacterium]
MKKEINNKKEKKNPDFLKQEAKRKSQLFNRFMLFRYSLSVFFFANLYWFIVQIFQPSFYLLIPILLLISIILATAEQFKLYSSTIPVLKKTELALKLQAIINVTVILLVLLNQTSILFPTFTNRTAAKALVIGLQVLGLSLVSLNLKRAEQVKHNVDKHYLRFQTIEKYL